MGLSRDTFYRYKSAIEEGGMEALFEKSRRKPNLKNRVDEKTDDSIWKSRTGYFLIGRIVIFGVLGIGAVVAAGIIRGWRFIPSNAVPSIKQAVGVATTSLLVGREVEAKPIGQYEEVHQLTKEINDEGSQTVKSDPRRGNLIKTV